MRTHGGTAARRPTTKPNKPQKPMKSKSTYIIVKFASIISFLSIIKNPPPLHPPTHPSTTTLRLAAVEGERHGICARDGGHPSLDGRLVGLLQRLGSRLARVGQPEEGLVCVWWNGGVWGCLFVGVSVHSALGCLIDMEIASHTRVLRTDAVVDGEGLGARVGVERSVFIQTNNSRSVHGSTTRDTTHHLSIVRAHRRSTLLTASAPAAPAPRGPARRAPAP